MLAAAAIAKRRASSPKPEHDRIERLIIAYGPLKSFTPTPPLRRPHRQGQEEPQRHIAASSFLAASATPSSSTTSPIDELTLHHRTHVGHGRQTGRRLMETAPINPGARPTNETSEAAAAANVQAIFNSIAPSYDRLNHLLSMGLDRRWWNRSARAFRTLLAQPQTRVLDLCCGTGDMTAALLKLRPSHHPVISTEAQRSGETRSLDYNDSSRVQPIIGLDFSPHMLNRARLKYAHRQRPLGRRRRHAPPLP